MQDTRLQLIDQRPEDPLRFDLRHYRRQLMAGQVRVAADDGLVVLLPDQEEHESD